jgi:hypothetical protein
LHTWNTTHAQRDNFKIQGVGVTQTELQMVQETLKRVSSAQPDEAEVSFPKLSVGWADEQQPNWH